MSDKDSTTPPDKPATDEPQKSGRVAYDARGNPIWEWQTSTGVFDRDVSTQRLKKLEAKLSLEETQPVPKTLAVQEPERLPGGAINPYDTGGRSNNTAPAAHPALVHKQAARAPKSNSLVSKHAASKQAVSKRDEPLPPQGFWQKLKARFSGDK